MSYKIHYTGEEMEIDNDSIFFKNLNEKLDSVLEFAGDDTVIVVYGCRETGKSLFLELLRQKTGIQNLSNRVINDTIIKNFSKGVYDDVKGIILDDAEDFIERNKGKKIEGGFYALSLQAPTADKDTHSLLKTMKKVQNVFGEGRIRIVHLQ